MNRESLIQEVERDFNILSDFAKVCGLNAELIECMLRLQLKVRGLYKRPPPERTVRAYRPKTRPKKIAETFEPIQVESNTRWG